MVRLLMVKLMSGLPGTHTMGQAPSSRVLQQTTDHQSDAADRAADTTHHAMAKQQWELQLKARLRALQRELRTLIEEGMQSIFLPLLTPSGVHVVLNLVAVHACAQVSAVGTCLSLTPHRVM